MGGALAGHGSEVTRAGGEGVGARVAGGGGCGEEGEGEEEGGGGGEGDEEVHCCGFGVGFVHRGR